MFNAFLQEHPLEKLLREGTRELYPVAEDRKAVGLIRLQDIIGVGIVG